MSIKSLLYTFRMNYKHGFYYLRKFGIGKTIAKIKSAKYNDLDNYKEWINNNECVTQNYGVLKYTPKISVVVPVYNVLDKHLIPCIESVLNQTYSNFELCIADDNSSFENVKKTLKKYESYDKVKIVYRSENGHICQCTNTAIGMATGEFIAFLDCDDILSPIALYEVARRLNDKPCLDFIYSDEDLIDDNGGNRRCPNFKPDWSPDTLMSNMYTCHLGVYRTSRVRELGGLREGYEGSQDYDFALRFTEGLARDNIAHIPKILYHWRERAESTSVNPESKPYILKAARKAKEDALVRRGLNGYLELIDELYQWRVVYIPQGDPLVSIITDDVLKTKNILKNTNYKNIEILDSVDKASGDYYLFLDSNLVPQNNDWVERLLGHAQIDYAGAVGAKILDKKSNILACGYIADDTGYKRAFEGLNDKYTYYFGRNKEEFNWLCVSEACFIVSKDKYLEYCGRHANENPSIILYNNGYYNTIRCDVIMRGNLINDKKYKPSVLSDPFYNRNFSTSDDTFSLKAN